ncbi:MAG: ATP-dependent sacrificial sulfur transferase LarE, partial [Candidatus Zixiibacteriota bacterium]
ASVKILGPSRVWAATSHSESYAAADAGAARKIAEEIGLPEERYLHITTGEMDNPDYVKNSKERCYFCKAELFSGLAQLAAQKNIEVIFDGANQSDLGDFRPGERAAKEHQVRSPLREAELTKDEIREIARRHSLSFSEKAASACLASRIPYGTPVTAERLRRIERAEAAVRALGFNGFRVRYHDSVARLEMRPEDIGQILENGLREKVVAEIKQAGFAFVTVDLEGYRQGSLNSEIKQETDDG